ncbi:serine/arginine-rich splicing factor SR45a isoform X2 [Humulus lupulus]|nr:serine/arginine-rich splicing factor SR45a isoform X2 [Humulus lupulus]
MSYSRRSRYSRSPSPIKRYGRSISRSLSRSRSRSRSRSPMSDVENPGNNLYVTGLSPRITKRELEKHFSTEGTVVDVHLVVDPWTRESRGFGFVTMSKLEEADRCIKYLNRSVLEGRVITVEKARRRRGRTPTPGRYLGLRTIHVRRGTPSHSPRRSPSYSPYRGSLSRSPGSSSDRSRSISYSPDYRRRRSHRRRSYSPYDSRRRSYSRSRSPYSRSPVRHRDRAYSPCDSRDYSPDGRYYGSRYRWRDYSPDDRYYVRRYRSRDYSPDDHYYERRHRYCSVSPSVSPRVRGSSRRSYSRSPSPRPKISRRSYSRSVSPDRRSVSRSISPSRSSLKSGKRSYSRSRSRSRSVSATSRSDTPS